MADELAALRQARERENLLGVSREARALLTRDPALAGGWGEVAGLALQAGDTVAARDAAAKLVEALPRHRDSWLWLASCEAELGRSAQALDIVRNQLAGAPEDAALNRRIAKLLLDAGRNEEAQRHFRAALKVDQSDALAWEGLARARTFEKGDDAVAAMEEWRISYGEETPAEQRGILSFALAKAYEDMGEYDVAARRVWEAAAFYRASAPFDVDLHETGVKEVLTTYDEAFAGAQEEAGLIDSRPVFILAPPAAGASWLARVLASGEDVAALARDNALFWMSAAPLGDHTRDNLLRALGAGGDGVLAEVGKIYLAYAEERFGRTRRIVDSSSTVEISAGAIGLCLPAAKFIHISRNREDLAWAILKRRFARARHWTYHGDDIARVLATHEQLIERWQTLFPDRFLTTSYEALAADPEDEVRRIAFFAGIDPDTAAKAARAEAGLFERDPVGVHERAGDRFEPVAAALKRAGLS